MENIIKWKNFELLIRSFEHSHANGGRLNKLWVEDRLTGRVFMIKGSSYNNYEPFSEKLAYIVEKFRYRCFRIRLNSIQSFFTYTRQRMWICKHL